MNANGKDMNPPGAAPVSQTPPDMVPTAEVQAIINELTFQRNMMADRAANLAIQLRMAQKAFEDYKAAQPGMAAAGQQMDATT